MKACLRLCAVCALAAAFPLPSFALHYQITDLQISAPTLTSYATGINDSGQIVGNGSLGAFLYTPGSALTYLYYNGPSGASAVNSTGQVAGSLGTMDPGADYPRYVSHACIYTQSGTVQLDMGPYESYAAGINDAGQAIIQGYSLRVYTPGTGVQDFGYIGNSSTGYDINNCGWVVGECIVDVGNTYGAHHSIVYRPGVGIAELDSSYAYSLARAVNDVGQVVGSCKKALSDHLGAFVYTVGGGMVELGTLPGRSYSWANDINNAGWVVGGSPGSSQTDRHAFVYTPEGGMVDLGTLGGTQSEAFGINSSGQIVGWAYTSSGVKHAVRWDLVPEPSSLLAVLVSLAGFAVTTWRRRYRG